MIEKIESVKNQLKNKKVAIAFSGGADSTLISYLAKEVTKDLLAITINNNLMPSNFLNESMKIANELDIKQIIIKEDFYKFDEFLENKSNRCYLCREKMYEKIIEVAKSNNFTTIIDGTNISDLLMDRPGILINYKNNIISPFVNASLESYEIHKYLDKNNINYLKASTCIATRFQDPINKNLINKIKSAEDFIKSNTNCEIIKVRQNKEDVCICEVDSIDSFLGQDNRIKIVDYLKSLDFKKVYLNLTLLQDNEKITLENISKNNFSFKHQLPYKINIEDTFNLINKFKKSLKNKNKIITRNITIFENGKIIGKDFKNEKDAKKEFINILPFLRRKI